MATKLIVTPTLRSTLERKVDSLEARLAAAKAALDRISQPPAEPSDQDAVIRFRKYNQLYTFAALKIGSRWFVTQDGGRTARQGYAPKTWEQLLTWIGERNWHTIEVLS